MSGAHEGLTTERWRSFDFSRQVLMIANELHRARKLGAPEDAGRRSAAFERVLALSDLTIGLTDRPARLRELLRWRDLVASAYLSPPDGESERQLLRTLLRFHPTAAAQIEFVAR